MHVASLNEVLSNLEMAYYVSKTISHSVWFLLYCAVIG